jgi:hypothetical protein
MECFVGPPWRFWRSPCSRHRNGVVGPTLALLAAALTQANLAAPQTPPAPAPSVCSATLHGAFHLRPVVTDRRIGPEVSGPVTEVGVLALTGVWRQDEATLARVRVAATGAEGYAFVRAVEFATTCPLIALDRGVPGGYPASGTVPHRPEQLLPDPSVRRPLHRPIVTYATNDAAADYTGDGRVDEIVVIEDRPVNHFTNRSYVLRWRDALGVGRTRFAMWLDALRHTTGVGTLSAGAIHLITWQSSNVSGMCHRAEDEGYSDGRANFNAIYRWHPSGHVLPVWTWQSGVQAEPVDLVDTPDGNLAVVGRRTQRRQRLLWNPDRFTFEAEGPTFPVDLEDFRCDPSPRPPYADAS